MLPLRVAVPLQLCEMVWPLGRSKVSVHDVAFTVLVLRMIAVWQYPVGHWESVRRLADSVA